MIKKLFLIIALSLSYNTYSQISFEKGYYIDNSDKKVECFIRNVDWKNNPTEFEYKLTETSEKKTLKIQSAKEFGVYNELKYIRSTVNIERSNPNSTNALSDSGEPISNEEELFLKVLIEGEANLYLYSDGNLTKYFYNIKNSEIEQLIYIKYKTLQHTIKLNQHYKQQLLLNLKCSDIVMKDLSDLDFKRLELINFFIKYNECSQSKFVNYQEKQKRNFFHLTLKPRLNYSSLEITNDMAQHRYTDFGNSVGYGMGIEAEFILPFNNDKWSLFIDPSYNSIKFEDISDNKFITYLPDGKVYGKADLKSLEFPIGIRHHFFINDKSKIFINVAVNFNSYLNSTVEFDAVNNSYHLNTLKTNGSTSISYGIGYNYNKKISLELRRTTSKEFLSNYAFWYSDYKNPLSIIFGYTLF